MQKVAILKRNLTVGSPIKIILIWFLLGIWEYFFNSFITLDAGIISRLVGGNTLAAIGPAGAPIYSMIDFRTGFATKVAVRMKRYLGSGIYVKCKQALRRPSIGHRRACF